MALKNYAWRGFTWQFEESEAPADAVPVEQKAAKPAANKAEKPAANKSRSRAASKKAE